MRPGRLDRILYIGPPDQTGMEEILKIRMRNMNVEAGVDVVEIASLVSKSSIFFSRIANKRNYRQTSGCSGAEIVAVCQEAALLTMQQDMNAP